MMMHAPATAAQLPCLRALFLPPSSALPVGPSRPNSMEHEHVAPAGE